MPKGAQNKRVNANKISAEYPVKMKNHETITAHLENALKYHNEVAQYYKEGDYEKAYKSSVFALGHCCVARELLRDDAKNNSNKDFK